MVKYGETIYRRRPRVPSFEEAIEEALKEQELPKLPEAAPMLRSFRDAASAANNVANSLMMSFSFSESKIKGIYPQEDKKLIVVKWIDDTITKVQCGEEDTFDIYVGVALAYTYKMFGSNTQFRKAVDKFINKKEVK